MGVQVDLTAFKPDLGDLHNRIAFKYYINANNVATVWHEINCPNAHPEAPKCRPLGSSCCRYC